MVDRPPRNRRTQYQNGLMHFALKRIKTLGQNPVRIYHFILPKVCPPRGIRRHPQGRGAATLGAEVLKSLFPMGVNAYETGPTIPSSSPALYPSKLKFNSN